MRALAGRRFDPSGWNRSNGAQAQLPHRESARALAADSKRDDQFLAIAKAKPGRAGYRRRTTARGCGSRRRGGPGARVRIRRHSSLWTCSSRSATSSYGPSCAVRSRPMLPRPSGRWAPATNLFAAAWSRPSRFALGLRRPDDLGRRPPYRRQSRIPGLDPDDYRPRSTESVVAAQTSLVARRRLVGREDWG
jgi:hypothetical protein